MGGGGGGGGGGGEEAEEEEEEDFFPQRGFFDPMAFPVLEEEEFAA